VSAGTRTEQCEHCELDERSESKKSESSMFELTLSHSRFCPNVLFGTGGLALVFFFSTPS
jgi:hypothetical protein